VKHFLFFLLLIGCCGTAFSQGRAGGKVLEDKTYIGVGGVTVQNLSNKATIATDAAGAFSIVAKSGDLLKFSSVGYKTDTVLLTSMDILTIYLIPEQNMLNEVKVKELEFPPGAFSYKLIMGPMGSSVVRYQTDKNGNPIGGIKMSPSELLGGGKKKSEEKIERYERDTDISKVFNEETLGKYLPFTGQELTNFVILYKPSAEMFTNPNFVMTDYINACYQKFMWIPAEKRKSKELVELK